MSSVEEIEAAHFARLKQMVAEAKTPTLAEFYERCPDHIDEVVVQDGGGEVSVFGGRNGNLVVGRMPSTMKGWFYRFESGSRYFDANIEGKDVIVRTAHYFPSSGTTNGVYLKPVYPGERDQDLVINAVELQGSILLYNPRRTIQEFLVNMFNAERKSIEKPSGLELEPETARAIEHLHRASGGLLP